MRCGYCGQPLESERALHDLGDCAEFMRQQRDELAERVCKISDRWRSGRYSADAAADELGILAENCRYLVDVSE